MSAASAIAEQWRRADTMRAGAVVVAIQVQLAQKPSKRQAAVTLDSDGRVGPYATLAPWYRQALAL
jgi:hypothetical protein